MKAINPLVVKEVGVMSAMVFQHICYWMQSQAVDVIYRTNEELSYDLEGCVSRHQVQRAKQKLIDAELIKVSFDHKCKFVRTTYYRLTAKGKKLLLGLKVGKSKGVNNENKPSEQPLVELPTNVVVELPSNVPVESNVRSVEDDKTQECTKTTDVTKEPSTECRESTNEVVKSDFKQPWIPKHLYAQQKKDLRQFESLNKELIISEAMKESFDEGMLGNKKSVKGIPEHLLSDPKVARMFKHKR